VFIWIQGQLLQKASPGSGGGKEKTNTVTKLQVAFGCTHSPIHRKFSLTPMYSSRWQIWLCLGFKKSNVNITLHELTKFFSESTYNNTWLHGLLR
jgi:hypothetical protein